MKPSAVTLAFLLLASAAAAQQMPSRLSSSKRPSTRRSIAPAPPIITQPARPPSASQPSQPSPFDAGPRTYAPRYTPRYETPSRIERPGYSSRFYGGAIGVGDEGAPASDQQAAADQAGPYPPQSRELPIVMAPHAPDTFYVIPGCYAGNRPPNPDRLPKDCNVGKLKTTPVR
ncbi:MAG TPA: hypothetical protein VLV86_15605 [Vicinamibacterales bacterium]|nr:hypothetical protein [Vicinamibacterales bacterium]